MKANEFVKKYGIAEAKALVNAQSWTMRQIALSTTVDTKELTRLVESHELVERCGGLNSLKAWVKEKKSKLSLATYFHCNKPPVLIQIENAEKSIADVESYHVD